MGERGVRGEGPEVDLSPCKLRPGLGLKVRGELFQAVLLDVPATYAAGELLGREGPRFVK